MLSDISLDRPEMTVPCHPHPLTKKPDDHSGSWACDYRRIGGRCLSGITGFNMSKGVPAYDHRSCDFDLCEPCMKADIFIDRAKKLKT